MLVMRSSSICTCKSESNPNEQASFHRVGILLVTCNGSFVASNWEIFDNLHKLFFNLRMRFDGLSKSKQFIRNWSSYNRSSISAASYYLFVYHKRWSHLNNRIRLTKAQSIEQELKFHSNKWSSVKWSSTCKFRKSTYKYFDVGMNRNSYEYIRIIES